MELTEETKKRLRKAMNETDHGYDYGDLPSLRPGKPFHEKLLSMVRDRAQASHTLMEPRRDIWRRMEQNQNAYVPLNAVEQRQKSRDRRLPVRVIVPMSAATLETIVAFYNATFIHQPIDKLSGYGDKAKRARVKALEHAMYRADVHYKSAVRYQNMWRDAHMYGFGLMTPCWKTESVDMPVTEEIDEMMMPIIQDEISELGLDVKVGDVLEYIHKDILFEGPELRNIDPTKALLDPNCPIGRIQEAEYVGYMHRTNAMQLLRWEQDPEQFYFNGKYVRQLAEGNSAHSRFWGHSGPTHTAASDDTGREARGIQSSSPSGLSHVHKPVDIITLWIDLIPEEYGLSKKDTPEKWMISVAGDEVVIQAKPLNLFHGQFPVCQCSPDATGYEVFPTSRMESIHGLQETADWMVSSQVQQITTAVNMMFAVNPAYVHTEDLLKPGPNKLIRLKPNAFDNPIDNYIQQLVPQDVTGSHMTMLGLMMDLGQRGAGTEDVSMGNMRGALNERPGQLGVQAAIQQGMSRMDYLASRISEDTMRDIAFQKAFLFVQFMSEDMFIRITEPREKELMREFGLGDDGDMRFGPDMIEPSFDIVPHHGPQAGVANLQAMTTVIQAAMGVEGVAGALFQQIDLPKLFLQWARKSGFENVHDFVNSEQMQEGVAFDPGVGEDGAIQEQVQAGNMVPMEEAMGMMG